jgi:hypothetical protein
MIGGLTKQFTNVENGNIDFPASHPALKEPDHIILLGGYWYKDARIEGRVKLAKTKS